MCIMTVLFNIKHYAVSKHQSCYHQPLPTQPEGAGANVHTINSRALGLSPHPFITSSTLPHPAWDQPSLLLPSTDLSPWKPSHTAYTHQSSQPQANARSVSNLPPPRDGERAMGKDIVYLTGMAVSLDSGPKWWAGRWPSPLAAGSNHATGTLIVPQGNPNSLPFWSIMASVSF